MRGDSGGDQVRHFLGWDRPGPTVAAEWILNRYTDDEGPEIDLSRVIIAVSGARAGRMLRDRLVVLAEERYGRPLRMPTITTIGTLPEHLYTQRRPMASGLVQQLAWQKALRAVSPETLRPVLAKPYAELDAESQLSLAELFMRLHTELASECLDFEKLATRMDDLLRSGEWRELFTAQRECLAEKSRWSALAAVQRYYLEEILDKLVAGDGQKAIWDLQTARLYALNVKPNDIGTDCDVLLTGTVDMPRVIREILGHERVKGWVRALVFAPESEAEGFDAIGCLQTKYWTERTIPIDNDVIRLADTPHDQAEAVLQWMATLPVGTTRREVSVGVPDPGLISVLCRAGEDAGVPFSSPAGRTIAETAPYRFLAAIADYIQHHAFADLATLTRHPDVYRHINAMIAVEVGEDEGVPADGAAWLATLDRFQSRRPTLRLGDPTNGDGSGGDPDDRVFGAVRKIVDRLCAPLTGGTTTAGDSKPVAASGDREWSKAEWRFERMRRDSRQLVDWAKPIARLVAALYPPDTGRPEPDSCETASEHVVRDSLRAIDQVLEGWGEVPESLGVRLDGAAAIRLLLRSIGRIRAHDGPQFADTVELLGWLELAADDAPYLAICGMNESNVPTSRGGDLFLPNTLRTYLKIEDNDRILARDVYVLCRLAASRWSLRLIAGRRDDEDRPLIPSRLLFAAAPEIIAKRARKLFGEPVTEEPAVDASVANKRVEPAGESANGGDDGVRPDTSETPFAGKPTVVELMEGVVGGATYPQPGRFRVPDAVAVRIPTSGGVPVVSVTELRDYLASPYRYYLRHRLKLRPLDDRAEELDALTFGSLVHELFGEFAHSPEIVGSTDAGEIETFLSERLDRIAAEIVGDDPLPAVRVQIEQLRYRLGGFAQWQAGWSSQGWRIAYAEAPQRNDAVDTDRQEVDFQLDDGRWVRLRGRIDRIDCNDHGDRTRLVIFDYKSSEAGEIPEKTHGHAAASGSTGRKTTRPHDDGWTDLQLPLYRRLAAKIPIPGPDGDDASQCFPAEAFEVGYILLPKQPDAIGEAIATWNDDDFAGAEMMARRCIAGIIDGTYPFDPDTPTAIRNRFPEFAAICMENRLATPDMDEDGEWSNRTDGDSTDGDTEIF